MSVSILLISLLWIMMVTDVVGSSCTGGSVNGCSTIFSWIPFRKEFTPSCNRHDVCYSCGVKFEKTRLSCDNMFRDKMLETCKSHKKPKDCNDWAHTYYFAVRLFGGSHYKKTSKNWCSQAWVNSCV